MSKVNGRLRFGGNELRFSFGGVKMNVDVVSERGFSPEETEAINEVIDDLTNICAKLVRKINYECEAKSPFALFRIFMPRTRDLKKEEIRRVSTPAIKFRPDVRRIPAPEHAGRFYIELDGILLTEENGTITGWKLK